jgi:hypothetical protein
LVTIDDTGWLRSEIEFVFLKAFDRTLQPVMVRVGGDASDEAVLANGGVLASCQAYNNALSRLRQLSIHLTDLVQRGEVHLEHGSPAAYAYAQLSRLDELIDRRQQVTMGHGVVRLAVLHRETEFFQRCEAQLAPVIDVASGNGSEPPRVRRRVRRWMAWFPTRRCPSATQQGA